MPSETEQNRLIDHYRARLITRREAVQRVSVLLGGVALVGGNALLTGCRDDAAEEGAAGAGDAEATLFTDDEIAFLDEVAETILPETSTPGAKAAGVGPFMALMVRDTYDEQEQQLFREGITQIEAACQEMHGAGFMQATPAQRLQLLEQLDREQMEYMRARQEAQNAMHQGLDADPEEGQEEVPGGEEGDAFVPDQRQENTPAAGVSGAVAVSEDSPIHYFRMMKELALLGYFTSEIGYNQAMRYQETPGRFDPCTDYTPGEPAWAPHA